ncbi:hypothetical protein ACFFWE_15030 [Sphaerisporangium melleum]|uniref:hypothetical protein n=1 Tax=Sphaerisporangium melleum TaxID=321316 RepID=UPI00166824BA|nr:hypothetical protein [Sphaerisporangium melleum]
MAASVAALERTATRIVPVASLSATVVPVIAGEAPATTLVTLEAPATTLIRPAAPVTVARPATALTAVEGAGPSIVTVGRAATPVATIAPVVRTPTCTAPVASVLSGEATFSGEATGTGTSAVLASERPAVTVSASRTGRTTTTIIPITPRGRPGAALITPVPTVTRVHAAARRTVTAPIRAIPARATTIVIAVEGALRAIVPVE